MHRWKVTPASRLSIACCAPAIRTLEGLRASVQSDGMTRGRIRPQIIILRSVNASDMAGCGAVLAVWIGVGAAPCNAEQRRSAPATRPVHGLPGGRAR